MSPYHPARSEGTCPRTVVCSLGLIPSWARDSSVAAKMINARSETACTKSAFRDALKSLRCLIPADAFYEWQRIGKSKLPYSFEVNEASCSVRRDLGLLDERE